MQILRKDAVTREGLRVSACPGKKLVPFSHTQPAWPVAGGLKVFLSSDNRRANKTSKRGTGSDYYHKSASP